MRFENRSVGILKSLVILALLASPALAQTNTSGNSSDISGVVTTSSAIGGSYARASSVTSGPTAVYSLAAGERTGQDFSAPLLGSKDWHLTAEARRSLQAFDMAVKSVVGNLRSGTFAMSTYLIDSELQTGLADIITSSKQSARTDSIDRDLTARLSQPGSHNAAENLVSSIRGLGNNPRQLSSSIVSLNAFVVAAPAQFILHPPIEFVLIQKMLEQLSRASASSMTVARN